MRRMTSTHVRVSQLLMYAEDFHSVPSEDYLKFVLIAIGKLWNKFSHDMDDPYNVALAETMSYLSTAYSEGYSEERIIEDIMDDVEGAFDSYNAKLLDTEIPYYFYLLCTTLYDYLLEEEGIIEMQDGSVELVTIRHNRVDITFYG